MLSVLLIVLPIFALILAGWGARRIGVLGPHATGELNRFVVYLALPALLFDIISNAHRDEIRSRASLPLSRWARDRFRHHARAAPAPGEPARRRRGRRAQRSLCQHGLHRFRWRSRCSGLLPCP
ncbi:MAG: AEC family transporter [Novosphingobium sp.]